MSGALIVSIASKAREYEEAFDRLEALVEKQGGWDTRAGWVWLLTLEGIRQGLFTWAEVLA